MVAIPLRVLYFLIDVLFLLIFKFYANSCDTEPEPKAVFTLRRSRSRHEA